MTDLPGFENLYGEGPAHQGVEEREPSPRLKGVNRNQLLLRPVDVEKLVPPGHEVRAIREFAGRIDLSACCEDVKAVEGRAAAFDPRLLVSVWIYSYAKGVGAAREISRLCDYDPAYQRLTGCESIGYHALSDFRSTHKEAAASPAGKTSLPWTINA
jgi:transposase